MGEPQDQVQRVVDDLVDTGTERGVQVAVYVGGEQVVDVAAGVADPGTGRPMTAGTPVYNYSIGKALTASVVHVLAEQGVLAYELRVAEVWPEFAAHGKDQITLRQVLDHSAGIPGLPPDVTPAMLCDWDRVCAWIAGAEPWWEPGTRMGYHAYTFGFVLGEVVRRVTGRTISEVLRDDVAGPIGMADELYLGVPRSEHHRLAVLEDGADRFDLTQLDPGSTMLRSAPLAVQPSAALGNRPDVLAADIPAGGKISARGLARLYAALMGEVDGVRLISPQRLAEVTAVSSSGEDQVYGGESSFGLGFAIGGLDDEHPMPTVFGMAGAGGSWACGDTATGVALAITKNRVTDQFDTVSAVLAALADAGVGTTPA